MDLSSSGRLSPTSPMMGQLSRETVTTLRRQVVGMLMVWRELLAAGFRSPELLADVLRIVPEPSAYALRKFSQDLVDCLDKCTEDSAMHGAASAAMAVGTDLHSSSGSTRSSKTARGSDARQRFRRAIIGSLAQPVPPDGMEVPVDKAVTATGLAQGDTQPLGDVLTDYPRLLHFLSIRFGLVGEDPERRGSPELAPAKSAAFEAATLSDALTQAHMMWVQRHPLDYVVAAKKSSSPNRSGSFGSGASPMAAAPSRCGAADSSALGAVHSQQLSLRRLLLLNMQLKYPIESWSPLIQARDSLLAELSAWECESDRPSPELGAPSAGGSSAASISSQQAEIALTVRRLAAALAERLQTLPIHSSPAQLAALLMDMLTRALSQLTATLHEHNSALVGGRSAAKPTESPKVSLGSLLDRLSSIGSSSSKPQQRNEGDDMAAACIKALKQAISTVMQCQAANGWTGGPSLQAPPAAPGSATAAADTSAD